MSDEIAGRSGVVKRAARQALWDLGHRDPIFTRAALKARVEAALIGKVVQARSDSTRGTVASAISEVLRVAERSGAIRRLDRNGVPSIAVIDAEALLDPADRKEQS